MKSIGKNTVCIALEQNKIHLWFAFPDEIQDPHLLSEYKRLLIPEEAEKQQRFFSPGIGINIW